MKHWSSYQKLDEVAPFGCPMEQAISHVLASVFSSVPRGYSVKNLKTYINTRIHYLNNENLVHLYLQAGDKKSDGGVVNVENTMNLDIFNHSNTPNYH